jgi:hypothetical protein
MSILLIISMANGPWPACRARPSSRPHRCAWEHRLGSDLPGLRCGDCGNEELVALLLLSPANSPFKVRSLT